MINLEEMINSELDARKIKGKIGDGHIQKEFAINYTLSLMHQAMNANNTPLAKSICYEFGLLEFDEFYSVKEVMQDDEISAQVFTSLNGSHYTDIATGKRRPIENAVLFALMDEFESLKNYEMVYGQANANRSKTSSFENLHPFFYLPEHTSSEKIKAALSCGIPASSDKNSFLHPSIIEKHLQLSDAERVAYELTRSLKPSKSTASLIKGQANEQELTAIFAKCYRSGSERDVKHLIFTLLNDSDFPKDFKVSKNDCDLRKEIREIDNISTIDECLKALHEYSNTPALLGSLGNELTIERTNNVNELHMIKVGTEHAFKALVRNAEVLSAIMQKLESLTAKLGNNNESDATKEAIYQAVCHTMLGINYNTVKPPMMPHLTELFYHRGMRDITRDDEHRINNIGFICDVFGVENLTQLIKNTEIENSPFLRSIAIYKQDSLDPRYIQEDAINNVVKLFFALDEKYPSLFKDVKLDEQIDKRKSLANLGMHYDEFLSQKAKQQKDLLDNAIEKIAHEAPALDTQFMTTMTL